MTLEVPPKKEIIVYAPLTAKQEAFYTAVVNKTIAKMLGQEKVTKNQSWEHVRGLGSGCAVIPSLLDTTRPGQLVTLFKAHIFQQHFHIIMLEYLLISVIFFKTLTN